MSWDVFLFSQDPTKLADGAKPAPLGEAEEVRAKISKSLPKVSWADPAWGILDGDGWSIEFNHQTNGITDSVALHVRGGGNPISSIVKLCKENNWVALDSSSGDLMNLDAPSSKSWSQFQAYRDKVVAKSEQDTLTKSRGWVRDHKTPILLVAAVGLFSWYVMRVRQVRRGSH